MNRKRAVAGLVAVSVAASGCSDFLTDAGQNPNQATEVTAQQLFISVQAQGFVRQQGQLARTAAILTQQLGGINNQQRDWVSRWLGTEGDYNFQMQGFYTGGGLTDMRNLQRLASEMGDARLEAIAKIWEGYMMGTAASIWGDIPYREAAQFEDIKKPVLDPQRQVYADLQALLDNAIAQLPAGGGALGSDLVYNGNTDRWRRAAYTLKARYHLHTAERLGAPAYQAALAAALNGINEPPANVGDALNGQAPGNFRAFHGSTLETGNVWAQFLRARQDIVAGTRMLEIFAARPGDPRRDAYFLPNPSGEFVGASQHGVVPAGQVASLVNDPNGLNRLAYSFRQPLITWEENQLIIAEAKFQTGDPTAIDHVNNVRTSVGMAPLAGPVTLADIMTEKYIVLFQNIEVWNDFKRTCIPALVPGGTPQLDQVPGRVPYGQAERLNNPNIPAPNAYPVGTPSHTADPSGSHRLRNWNDPNPCPVPAS